VGRRPRSFVVASSCAGLLRIALSLTATSAMARGPASAESGPIDGTCVATSLLRVVDFFDDVADSRQWIGGGLPRTRSNSASATRRSAHAETNETPPTLLYEVVWYRGSWRVLHLRKYSAPFADQTAAISAATKTAREKRENRHPVEVLLRRTDGHTVVHTMDI
jgi:hypothetical protein